MAAGVRNASRTWPEDTAWSGAREPVQSRTETWLGVSTWST